LRAHHNLRRRTNHDSFCAHRTNGNPSELRRVHSIVVVITATYLGFRNRIRSIVWLEGDRRRFAINAREIPVGYCKRGLRGASTPVIYHNRQIVESKNRRLGVDESWGHTGPVLIVQVDNDKDSYDSLELSSITSRLRNLLEKAIWYWACYRRFLFYSFQPIRIDQCRR